MENMCDSRKTAKCKPFYVHTEIPRKPSIKSTSLLRVLHEMESPPLYLVGERIKTFKRWPYHDKDKCNVQNMAEAGFYSVSTGTDDADAAKCFLCGKELDGWEASDDPWAEHKSHARQCAFVQLEKKEDQLLLSEFLSILTQYMKNEINRIAELAKDQIDDRAKTARRKCLGRK